MKQALQEIFGDIELFEYIEVFYNLIRIHPANNYLAPVEFEEVNRKYLKSA